MSISISCSWESESVLDSLRALSGVEFVSAETKDGSRFYTFKTSVGGELHSYESVTTHLGSFSDKAWLDSWKDAVGHDVAERKTQVAADRGTQLHETLEGLLKGSKLHKMRLSPMIAKQLYGMIGILKEKLGKIYFSEEPLFSKERSLCGRCDLIADWSGILSLIDFKSSGKSKEDFERFPDILDSYIMQCFLYADMANKMFGLHITQLVILVAHPDGRITEEYRDIAYGKSIYRKMRQSHVDIGVIYCEPDEFDSIQPMGPSTGTIFPLRFNPYTRPRPVTYGDFRDEIDTILQQWSGCPIDQAAIDQIIKQIEDLSTLINQTPKIDYDSSTRTFNMILDQPTGYLKVTATIN